MRLPILYVRNKILGEYKVKNAVIYIHGKYGTAEEAEYYKKFFKEADVIAFEYTSDYPWNFKKEFSTFFDDICTKYKKISIIANSIGAYFIMISLSNKDIEKAFFISPIVDMEKLIIDMILSENITEKLKHHLEKHYLGNILLLLEKTLLNGIFQHIFYMVKKII